MTEYSDKKDSTLVKLTLLGNERAFEELVTRHERAVMGTAYKITENRFSAEDASQDAFVSAWIHLDTLKEHEKFGSWVCSIAKNCARDLVVRYQSKIPDIGLHLLENTTLTADDQSGLLDMLDLSSYREEMRDEQLHLAVEALGEKIRDAVKLHYFDGLSVSEIAALRGVPEGTVKWRLSEGRRQLRKEYGIMEHTYEENEALVKRVMRQVEELKLWALKTNKTGFETEWQRVRNAVEALPPSTEKDHAMADVLLRGYWWVPGQKSEELLAQIKEYAERSRNEDVMSMVIAQEHDDCRDEQGTIDLIREKQIPYLQSLGLTKTLAYAYYWMGVRQFDLGLFADCRMSAHQVLELLKPTDVYYANALSLLRVTDNRSAYTSDQKLNLCATGEVVREIGGKLYLWSQPGISRGSLRVADHESLIWNSSACDHLILDPTAALGTTILCSDGTSTLTFTEENVTVTAPAGIFEHCAVWEFEGAYFGLTHVRTVFCPDIGIVEQTATRYGTTATWQLRSYTHVGGEGYLPRAAGNVWSYVCISNEEGILSDPENRFEITGVKDGEAVFTHAYFLECIGFDNASWHATIRRAREEYYVCSDTGKAQLRDVSALMRRASELAATKRQRVHTAIASDVMARIFATSPSANPDYTQKGHWNFFQFYGVKRKNGQVLFEDSDYRYSFEWKDSPPYGMLFSFLYDILSDAAGCVWSDEWIEGYATTTRKWTDNGNLELDLAAVADETVTTPAGTFENCRHVKFTLRGINRHGLGYRGGKKEYWFAPNIGIVKFHSSNRNDELQSTWVLTAYRGCGDGYFPVADGLFRRYEPTDLKEGFHASVEYTFDEDENGCVLFRNAYGTEDRASYEANQKKKES